MKHLNREIVFFLIGIRWIGLFLGIISYIKNYDGNPVILIPLIVINIFFTVSVNRNIPQHQAFAIVFLDIFFNLILSYQTHGLNSPFFIYSLTTFIWLMFHANFSSVIISFIWYTVMSLGMEFYVRTELWPVQIRLLIWEAQVFLLIVIVLFILYHYGRTIVTIYRDIYLIQRVARTTIQKDIKVMTQKIEGLLFDLFKSDQTYVCWLHRRAPQIDWKHNHYHYMIHIHTDISQKRMGYYSIQGIDGQTKNTLMYPIKGEKREIIAYIVLVNEQPMKIKRFNLLYFHLISFVLYHRFQAILQAQEIEEGMKREVRTKLAQDMHDGLAQQLFFLNAKVFQLKMLTKKYDDPQLLDIIDTIGSQVENSHQEVRNYIESLRNIKKETNMSDAIERLLTKMTKGLSVEVSLDYKAGITQEAVEIEETIYRFIEEGVNNILKHARASKIEVSIDCNSLEWVVMVKDNGVGIESLDMLSRGRFGVRGMKERIEKIQGEIYFESIKNEGTSVLAVIPRRR